MGTFSSILQLLHFVLIQILKQAGVDIHPLCMFSGQCSSNAQVFLTLAAGDLHLELTENPHKNLNSMYMHSAQTAVCNAG